MWEPCQAERKFSQLPPILYAVVRAQGGPGGGFGFRKLAGFHKVNIRGRAASDCTLVSNWPPPGTPLSACLLTSPSERPRRPTGFLLIKFLGIRKTGGVFSAGISPGDKTVYAKIWRSGPDRALTIRGVGVPSPG